MRSKLIDGAVKSQFDPEIAEFISQYVCGSRPHVDMRVAIKNEAGEVYRLIIANGHIEMIRADKFLVSLGFREEFTDEFDILFRQPASRRIKESA